MIALRFAIPTAFVAAPALAQEGVTDTAQVTQADIREVIRRLAALRIDGNPGGPPRWEGCAPRPGLAARALGDRKSVV